MRAIMILMKLKINKFPKKQIEEEKGKGVLKNLKKKKNLVRITI